MSVLHEPSQLALGHGGVHHAEATVVPEDGLADAQGVAQPVVLHNAMDQKARRMI